MVFPLGEALTLEELSANPYSSLARLRSLEPVSWVPVLDGWLVTRRDLCVEVMRDASTYTVDDPRFSTAQVVGPSMLSLDGSEHRRHRDPFARALLPNEVKDGLGALVTRAARELTTALAPAGAAEIRRELAGPLAVAVVAAALGLGDVDVTTMLGWYDNIVADVDRLSSGAPATGDGQKAMGALAVEVRRGSQVGAGLLATAKQLLSEDEVVSNAAVMMFGGIETSEGMTTSLFWHLLTNPKELQVVNENRGLASAAMEESLRLEPAAGRVDRYATRDVELAAAPIRKGDLVIVSLTAANRDPDTFPDPDHFDLNRTNVRSHLAFAQGPHACIGIHLAKLETLAALNAALDDWPGLRVDREIEGATGLVFRKPRALDVLWN